jgi:PRTRC genetic system protein E
MIASLANLARSAPKGVMLLVNAVGADQISVAIIPQGDFEGDKAALSKPLQVTGTVEELTAGLEGAITQYVDARKTFEDQVADTIAVLEAAKKESAEKSKAALKAKSAKPAAAKAATPAADKDDDSDDDDDSNAAVATAPSAVAKPAAKADAFALNLD